MASSRTTTEHPEHTANGTARGTRHSTESRRQRDGSAHVGAFGMRAGESDLLFLEGILPEKDGEIQHDRPVDEQAALCLDRLETVLASQSVDLADVMKVEVQLTNMASRDAVDAVYRERFETEYPPRTTVGVCALPGDADVQLDVIAVDE